MQNANTLLEICKKKLILRLVIPMISIRTQISPAPANKTHNCVASTRHVPNCSALQECLIVLELPFEFAHWKQDVVLPLARIERSQYWTGVLTGKSTLSDCLISKAGIISAKVSISETDSVQNK